MNLSSRFLQLEQDYVGTHNPFTVMPFLAVQIHKKVLQYVSHFCIPDLQNKRTLIPGKCIWLTPKPGAAVQYMKFIVYIFFSQAENFDVKRQVLLLSWVLMLTSQEESLP